MFFSVSLIGRWLVQKSGGTVVYYLPYNDFRFFVVYIWYCIHMCIYIYIRIGNMHTALEGNDNFGSPVQTASPFESIWIFTAWKINGWFTYKKSPMKRKKMIWTKPSWWRVPSVNLAGFTYIYHKSQVNVGTIWVGKAPHWPGGFWFEQNIEGHIVFFWGWNAQAKKGHVWWVPRLLCLLISSIFTCI